MLRRTPLVSLLALALCLLVVSPASADDDPAETRELDFSLTAHRGAPTRGVGENTIRAFTEALAAGATAIEADLRRTKDDQFVVLHDSGVGRTTNCGGPIGDWTLEQLESTCREDKSHKPLPTGAELLEFVDRTDAVAMIELKGHNWSIRQIQRVVRLLKDSDAFDQVAISSLRVTVLQRVQRLAPKMPTQLIVPGWTKVQATLGEVSGYNVPAAALTRARVRRLHKQGLRVLGAYSDGAREWSQLERLRVDGVVVPSIRAYQAWSND